MRLISAPETQGHVARLLALSLGGAAAVANAYAVPEVIFSPDDSYGTRGAVASEASECSAIGRDIIATGVCFTSFLSRPAFGTLLTEF